MKDSFLNLLQCPYCKGGFQFANFRKPLYGVDDFGVISCACSKFPVIDGIPIIQKAPVCMYENTSGRAHASGIAIQELVRLIENGRGNEALLECLVVPTQLPRWMQKCMPWRVQNGEGMHRFLRNAEKRRLAEKVLLQRARLKVVQILEYFFPSESLLGYSQGQYFLKRCCQPRHLAALALLARVPSCEKPVLDIACGIGHLEHYFTNRTRYQSVVGTDMNFFHVWIAKHWFAPKAFYVCANAGEGLPFANTVFSATICSDAYHYIPNREELLIEIERCGPKQPVILTRVGNKAVMPNEGREASIKEYIHEIGSQEIFSFAEPDLVKSYLKDQNPYLHFPKLGQQLEETKWVTFVWNATEEMQHGLEIQKTKPHLVGKAALNPIYSKTIFAKNEVRFRFEFPDIWYAYENNGMLAYHRRFFSLENELWEKINENQNASLKQELIDAFVLIGLPERF